MAQARFTRGYMWLVGNRSAKVQERRRSGRNEPDLTKISEQYQTDEELTAFTTHEMLLSCTLILGARIYIL